MSSFEERTNNIAQRYKIEDQVNQFKEDLLKIPNVLDVEFNLDGFLDGINYIIFLTKYDIPVQLKNYYSVRREVIRKILEVTEKHGLKRTEDRIEDYGNHFYFVTKCDKTWIQD